MVRKFSTGFLIKPNVYITTNTVVIISSKNIVVIRSNIGHIWISLID